MSRKKAMEPSGEELPEYIKSESGWSPGKFVAAVDAHHDLVLPDKTAPAWQKSPPSEAGVYLHVEFACNGPIRLIAVVEPSFYANDRGFWFKTGFPLP